MTAPPRTCAFCGERDADTTVTESGRAYAACWTCHPPGTTVVVVARQRDQVQRQRKAPFVDPSRLRAILDAEPGITVPEICERLGHGRCPARHPVWRRVHSAIRRLRRAAEAQP